MNPFTHLLTKPPSMSSSPVQSQAVPTERVPPGVLAGVVLDSSTATPLSGVQIWFQPDSGGGDGGVISNNSGLFRIRDLPAGTGRLHWEFLGYASEEMSLTIDSRQGYAARLVLRPVSVCVCGTPSHALPAVSVSARDATTGRVPESAVTLILRDGSYVDTAFAEVESLPDSGFVFLGGAKGRVGTYDVSVLSQGYRTWQLDGVVVSRDCCNRMQPRRLDIWLLPQN